MKQVLFCGLFLCSFLISTAQKATYKFPESIKTDQFQLTFQKISSASSSYYINYKIENNGNGVLLLDRSKTTLRQNDGLSNALSKKYQIKPAKNQLVYNQFRVKSPMKAHGDLLTLTLDGLRYANNLQPIESKEKFALGEKAIQNIGSFEAKVMEYKVYSDRIYTQIKCTFNGSTNTIGKIDLSKIKVDGGKAKIVKKGDFVFTGKSYTFSINITPDNSPVTIDWTGVLNTLKVNPIQLDKILIKSTKYKEPEKVVAKPQKDSITTAQKPKNCALSYDDFNSLKSDIKKELDAGGKPVEMSREFILSKKCINTNQVIELLPLFNLDGQKLKFAKMAYKFTSDKQRYSLVVGKLSYVKNKQALEEFLELQ